MHEQSEEISERDRLMTAYVERIKEAQNGFRNSAMLAGNSLISGANFRRQMGLELKSMREAKLSGGSLLIAHGEWLDLFRRGSNYENNRNFTFDFSHDSARNYIAFAAKHPNPITNPAQIIRDNKQLFIDAGMLDAPDGHGHQNAQPSSCKWLGAVLRAWEQITKEAEKRPVTDWNPGERITLKEKLRPLAELYQTL